ncbi:protein of unknown function [Hyphomicrobium sp. 1Nfss2.1]
MTSEFSVVDAEASLFKHLARLRNLYNAEAWAPLDAFRTKLGF